MTGDKDLDPMVSTRYSNLHRQEELRRSHDCVDDNEISPRRMFCHVRFDTGFVKVSPISRISRMHCKTRTTFEFRSTGLKSRFEDALCMYVEQNTARRKSHNQYSVSLLSNGSYHHHRERRRKLTRLPLKDSATTLFYILLVSLMVLSTCTWNVYVDAQEQMDPMTFHGGSAMAMAGNECVALAVDKRFASGPQMVAVSPRRVLHVNSHCLIALVGLDGDVQTLSQELSTEITHKVNRAHMVLTPREDLAFFGTAAKEKLATKSPPIETKTNISPKAMSQLMSHVLYSHRASPLYCEPLLVGLHYDSKYKKYRPLICSTDMLGAKMMLIDNSNMEGDEEEFDATKDAKKEESLASQTTTSQDEMFACIGAATQSMYGTAEALWRPNLSPSDLVRVCGRAFLSALERDCLSGYGALIYLITPGGGIQQYDLESRND